MVLDCRQGPDRSSPSCRELGIEMFELQEVMAWPLSSSANGLVISFLISNGRPPSGRGRVLSREAIPQSICFDAPCSGDGRGTPEGD